MTEYEAQQTTEVRCTRDADKLECMIQAIEYRDALRTHTAHHIATPPSTHRPSPGADDDESPRSMVPVLPQLLNDAQLLAAQTDTHQTLDREGGQHW